MYYFAYGSNMNWGQMQRRCPSAEFVCVGRLPDYCLAIARHSQLRKCGTANIFVKPGTEVWGIVYRLSDQDFLNLDRFEDGYERRNVLVMANGLEQKLLEASAYIAKKEDAPLPNPEYKRLMLEGAKHWRLPQDYIAMLEQIAVETRAAP